MTPTLTETGGGPTLPPKNNTSLPSTVEWTGCSGFAILLPSLNEIHKGTLIPGWGPNSSPFQQIQLDFYKCERIRWGPFERGPVYMLQEWQANFNEPKKCDEGAVTRAALESIWFSDSEIADYARSAYGMPAFATNFTFLRAPLAPAGSPHDWSLTWTPPGGTTSSVTLHSLEPGFNSTVTYEERLFWFNGQGISYFDMSERYERSDVGADHADGILAPPMMWGRDGPTSQFVTRNANLQGSASVTAKISRFGDVECTKPL
ncbi:MAG TPA: hypothetical protein VM241_05350 [Candidatus Thermoplasmatota archaeon]|nr:hypothetical protein [Candidatus Thermoplasmatota archaeon]